MVGCSWFIGFEETGGAKTNLPRNLKTYRELTGTVPGI